MVAVKNYLLVFFLLLYFGDIWNIFDTKSQAIKFIKENNIDLASDEDPRIICKTNERYGNQDQDHLFMKKKKKY